ncbi:potassium transporter Kup [Dermatophilaceae bacterium Soc4.6]
MTSSASSPASSAASSPGSGPGHGSEPDQQHGRVRGADRNRAARTSGDKTGRPPEGPTGPEHGGPVRPATAGLVLGALGVVFGDIGTSPLYALQTVFSLDQGEVKPTPDDVYGVISLVFWSVTLIVSVKYVLVVMRADNDGEGGVMALAALARRLLSPTSKRTKVVMTLGVLGASLFYGDSVITPAISVLSAVEGITVSNPGLASFVVPIAATILTVLFAAQRFGTGRVGSLFGPVMLVWFAAIALAGLTHVVGDPAIIRGLSPSYAISFVVSHPGIALIALGAVVLSITGAEALYADMGHFGRPAISRAWFWVAFPALVLNYLGQGALILKDPKAISNPFFLLVPGWATIPMVVLATAATVIASQAVISGAFSMSRQAVQLGFLPPLTVKQTSDEEQGQIYLPFVNAALFVVVLVLMVTFGSSAKLATAYGVSVTGALLIDTLLLLSVARILFGWSTSKLVLAGVAFGGTEAAFLSANFTKIIHGGWLPLLIAAVMFTVMTTWQRGRELIIRNRTEVEGSLMEFIRQLPDQHLVRVPGTAVFPHPSSATTPLALRANVEHNGVLHEHVVIVSAQAQNVPHVPLDQQVTVDDLGNPDDGIIFVSIKYGFADRPDLPEGLTMAAGQHPETHYDADTASYFLSRATLRAGREPGMQRWRKLLFIGLAHNAADPSVRFHLPPDRTVVMGSRVDL